MWFVNQYNQKRRERLCQDDLHPIFRSALEVSILGWTEGGELVWVPDGTSFATGSSVRILGQY